MAVFARSRNEESKAKLRNVSAEINSEFTDELKIEDSESIKWNVTPGSIKADLVSIPTSASSGGALADGDYGDITVSGSGTVMTVDNDVVTFAKIQNITSDRLIGRDTASSGDPEEISLAGSMVWTGSQSVQLDGDSASPGNSKLYGTDGSGVKGWYAQPSGSDPWTYLVLSSDFSTSSASAVNVTGLIATVTNSLNYEFEAILMMRTATATVNPRVGLIWPAGSAVVDGTAMITESQAATGTPLFASGNVNAALLIAVGGLPNTTQSWPATIKGNLITTTGSFISTNLGVQLASETAGTSVTIKAGSFLKYRTY